MDAFIDEKNLVFLQGERRALARGESPNIAPCETLTPARLQIQYRESPAPGALLHISYTPSWRKRQIPCLILWVLPQLPTQLPACHLPTGLWSGQPGKYRMLLGFHLPIQPRKAPSQIFGQQADLEKSAKLALLYDILWSTKHGIKNRAAKLWHNLI